MLKIFTVGFLASNSYLYYNEEKEAYLFDIGGRNIKKIVDFIKEKNLNLTKLILTHGHIDHIEGINDLLEYKNNIKIYIGKEDKKFLYEARYNLSVYFIGSFELKEEKINPIILEDNDFVQDFQVISTPGHTKGSLCFYNKKENFLISGDTIFKGSLGRTDFPDGNPIDLNNSLKKIFELIPENTIIYPGHGESTIIKNEKLSIFNYYEEY